jgi:heptosyltransferase-1
LKILIVKRSSLGDVVHAMPAVQNMVRAVPHAQIDWAVERGFAPLVRRCAGVHRVIECELRRWRKSPCSRLTRQAWQAFKLELQRESYDAVIDLQGLSKSALVAWLARLTPQGQRYGLANRTEGSGFEALARWVAQVPIQVPVHSAAVARSRLLCAQALGYAVPEIQSFGLLAGVNECFEQSNTIAKSGMGASGRRGTVALVHGTSRADKERPMASWQALGQRLNASGFAVALPHGNEAEQHTAQAIASTLSDAVVWPRLGLDALTDALATCAVGGCGLAGLAGRAARVWQGLNA